jgi:hypothetical protein
VISGLVVHTGRAGSTLLCNLLTTSPGWVAIKEPEVVNAALLRMASRQAHVDRRHLAELSARVLTDIAHGVERDHLGNRRRCVIKLTSWNAVTLPELLPILGPIPIVLVVRDPWSTIASLLDEPPHWHGPASTDPVPTSHDARFSAEVWCAVVEAVLRLSPNLVLHLSYEQVARHPGASMERVARHFGHDSVSADPQAIEVAAALYSKAVSETFEPASRHRRPELDDLTSALVTELAGDTWARWSARAPGGAGHTYDPTA